MLFSGSAIVLAEEIIIVGTGSGMALLQTVADEYMKAGADIKITVPDSIGSSGGIKAVGTDQYRIGRVGRELRKTESHYSLSYVPFAKLPIIFFTNKSVTVENISPQQACDIYSGKITNWQEVGGNDAKIRVVRREDGDSSLQVLQDSLPGFKEITITPKSKTALTDQETLEFVESVKDTIAFGTYGNAKTYNVNVLSIEGKNPENDDYPYTGSLALIFKEKNRKGDLLKFIEYVRSPAASDAIRKAGGLPF